MNNLHIQSLLNNINSGIDLQTQIASIKKVFAATDSGTKVAIAEIAVNHAKKHGYEAPSNIFNFYNEILEKARAEAEQKARAEAEQKARAEAEEKAKAEASSEEKGTIEFEVSFVRHGNKPVFLNQNKYKINGDFEIPDQWLKYGFEATMQSVHKNIEHYYSGHLVGGEFEGPVYQYTETFEIN